MKVIDQLQSIVQEVLWGKHLLEVTVVINHEDHRTIERELYESGFIVVNDPNVILDNNTIIKLRLGNGSLIHFLRSYDLPKGTIFVVENNSIFKLTIA